VSAGGASEALAALKGRDVPVDLLLTDIVMPGMSGPELAGHLRRLQLLGAGKPLVDVPRDVVNV